ncbi:tetratricopeptide repeat protein [Aureivirga sp. CE67]|uniref:tetratricopeptide repeat protein n=1 Tax=Aureivirga sp. CE67 TaxID=1788983 RepID=UPI0018CBEEF6|nr:tetratricopeptide repeat protein [Aureivirga sp. CE67]
MATYKKKPSKEKKVVVEQEQPEIEEHSTTAEVFDTLDETANKSEEFIMKNQKAIYGTIGVVVVCVLGYLGYQKFVSSPNETEAANELAFPKQYFTEATANEVANDSLLNLGLTGADGKLGFLDVATEYSGTKAGNLANFYAGASYLKMKDYQKAIQYLDAFKADDEIVAPSAIGAIGDSFANLEQLSEALSYYEKAAKLKVNEFSTPLFLYKAALTAMDLKEYAKAEKYFTEIKNKYPSSNEGKDIELYINKAKFAQK